MHPPEKYTHWQGLADRVGRQIVRELLDRRRHLFGVSKNVKRKDEQAD